MYTQNHPILLLIYEYASKWNTYKEDEYAKPLCGPTNFKNNQFP